MAAAMLHRLAAAPSTSLVQKMVSISFVWLERARTTASKRPPASAASIRPAVTMASVARPKASGPMAATIVNSDTALIAAVAVAFAKYLGVFLPAIGEGTVLFSVGRYPFTTAQAVGLVYHAHHASHVSSDLFAVTVVKRDIRLRSPEQLAHAVARPPSPSSTIVVVQSAPAAQLSQKVPGAILGPVVDNDDFLRHI